MSKNKFFKKLLVAGLCAVTATAVIGATACDKGKKPVDPIPPPIDQTTEYTVSFDLDGGTWSNAAGYTVKVEEGGKLPANLATPTNGDKVFGGWYSGTSLVVPGTTVITADMTLKAKWNDPAPVEPNKETWLVSEQSVTEDQAVEANAEIVSNDLFAITAQAAMTYTVDVKKPANADFGAGGATKGLRTGEYATGEDTDTVTVTAKENITLKVYVALADMTYNGSRSGGVYYTLNDDKISLSAGDVTGLTDAAKTITVDLKKDDALKIYARNTHASKARLWLFGAEAVENANPVTVNYYYGEKLISRRLVADGATLEKPADPVNGENKFLGWYTDNGGETEYTFGALTAGTASVNVYAKFQVSDVVINYYLDQADTTPWKTVNAYSGGYAEEVTADQKADGSEFLGWTTSDGNDYDWEHTALVAGTLDLYAKYSAAPTEGVEGAYTYTVKKGSDGSYSIVYAASDGASTTAEKLFTDNSAIKDSETFKFGANTDNLVLTMFVGSGSTITLNISGYTGSSGNATGIKAEVDESKVTASTSNPNDNIVEFTATSSKTAIENGSLVYTANEDGLVTITLSRSVSKGAKITALEVVVAKAGA